MLTGRIFVIILQYVQLSNYYVVQLMLRVNYTSAKKMYYETTLLKGVVEMW